MTRTRAALIASISTLAVAGCLLPATTASAASPDVVVAEVYGGGGNSGARWTNDFVELSNAGTAPVDVTGWTVQYASASGTSWQATPLSGNPAARVVVLGDLNDFQFSQTADILVGSGAQALTDLPRTLPPDQQYTYDYQGNSEVLDHILLSPALTHLGYGYDVVHVNAEFADQISDHDPQVVRLGPSAR